MTSRERWTVYPLLLLAIGLSIRGNMPETLHAGHVISHQIDSNQLKVGHVVAHELDAHHARFHGEMYFEQLNISNIYLRNQAGEMVRISEPGQIEMLLEGHLSRQSAH